MIFVWEVQGEFDSKNQQVLKIAAEGGQIFKDQSTDWRGAPFFF